MVITGTGGLSFIETKKFTVGGNGMVEEKTEYEVALRFGGGLIAPINTGLHAVGELVLQTRSDFFLLTGGADYQMNSGRVRGFLGFGLDNGAPNFTLGGSYLIELN